MKKIALILTTFPLFGLAQIKGVIKETTSYRITPSITAPVDGYVQKGDTLVLLAKAEDPFIKVRKKDSIFFVAYFAFEQTPALSSFIKGQNGKKLNSLTKKYGTKYGTAIYNNQILLGMSEEMVIEVLGVPETINRSRGKWGAHDQWVYKNKYLYFDNYKLTAWQN